MKEAEMGERVGSKEREVNDFAFCVCALIVCQSVEGQCSTSLSPFALFFFFCSAHDVDSIHCLSTIVFNKKDRWTFELSPCVCVCAKEMVRRRRNEEKLHLRRNTPTPTSTHHILNR